MIHHRLRFLLLVLLLLSGACRRGNGVLRQERIAADTTINASNAYNSVFLDSTTLEQFINAEARSDSLAGFLRRFYAARNYGFAWFDEAGLTVQAQGFWSAHHHAPYDPDESGDEERRLHALIDTLSSDSTYRLSQAAVVNAELRFTKHFFEYVTATYGSRADPEQFQWHIPRRSRSPQALLDSLLVAGNAAWRPMGRSFQALRTAVLRYHRIRQRGGWQAIPVTTKRFRQGERHEAIRAVRLRLQQTGELSPGDTGDVYTASLQAVVEKTRAAYGLPANGGIDASLIQALNVPVDQRIRQMLINLERMKWMPELPERYLLANIPEYRLHVVWDGQEALAMNIVVGKAANKTVIFSDQLKFIVFCPYWNVPRSIVRNEIYPAMRRNSNYLRRNNMEVVGHSGGLPVIRQKPGPRNSLGRIKFLFPNSYNIYFHDTPAKSLFERDRRAFSHGCVRLEKPEDLAVLLLEDDPEWNREKIRAAMNRSVEKWVTLEHPVPVFLTYFTSWVDAAGTLYFVDDVYGHDRRMAEHLFE